MIKNKSVRFSGSDEENNGRKRRWRLFRRNKAAPEPEELSDNPLMSDKYSKFTEEDPTDSMPRKMAVHPRAKTKKDFKPRKEVFLSAPPAARQAAFGGPPRYDWIDIETTAAIKVQAAYRRNKVMNDLERQGVSTGAIRNRARRRHADSSNSFLNCCGHNFSFADFSSDDREAHREYQKMVYEEQKKARYQYEEELRTGYSKLHNIRQSKKNQLDEAFEIVE
eukprot:CAMPEP_0172452880 /NCGR_PEP_ID=MMETSP1065-20121228/10412_1 /TAXON_ID=265537 /ORGANISM="Amphiprora paludosa, Strain CCMP125" /LENGTH=221 /DNA_ID=CAMNT_0013205009 /DNA_START=158 /DNA_END=823 /DNA_ORIENTATION=-